MGYTDETNGSPTRHWNDRRRRPAVGFSFWRVGFGVLILGPLVVYICLQEGAPPPAGPAKPSAKVSVVLQNGELVMGFDRELSRSDMATMFEDHLASAKAGDSFAKWRVGFMYYTGKGVLRDEAEGVRWLEQAADAGVKWAQFAMGWMCMRGKGGRKPDPARSLAYYQKAAATGDRYFAYALGEILYKGQGLPCDRVEGKRWLEKAAAGDRTFSELMAEVVATAR